MVSYKRETIQLENKNTLKTLFMAFYYQTSILMKHILFENHDLFPNVRPG